MAIRQVDLEEWKNHIVRYLNVVGYKENVEWKWNWGVLFPPTEDGRIVYSEYGIDFMNKEYPLNYIQCQTMFDLFCIDHIEICPTDNVFVRFSLWTREYIRSVTNLDEKVDGYNYYEVIHEKRPRRLRLDETGTGTGLGKGEIVI